MKCMSFFVAVVSVVFLSALLPSCTRIDVPLGRNDLEHIVDQYLEALIARDPGQAPLSPTVRYTENGQYLPVGDGLWNTANARGSYSLYVADTVTNQIGFFGTIRENGTPAILGLRLKVVNRMISEIETFAVRSDSGALLLEALDGPNPVFLKKIPLSDRVSRDSLVVTANKYFTGLQGDDGYGDYPFTDDCNRLENGKLTTNNPTGKDMPFDIQALGPKAQFESGFFRFVTRIRDRRLVVVDEERGLVFAFAFFDHAGNIPEVTLTNGMKIPIGVSRPWTWEIAELFKVEHGQLRQIEALYQEAPYGMNSGWSTTAKGLSTDIQYK